MKYNKIVLKLSGEALLDKKEAGINAMRLAFYADEIANALSLGVSIAMVIGGGNIYRGAQTTGLELPRLQGDYMGMLATAINGVALQSTLEKKGVPTRLMSRLAVEQVCEPYLPRHANKHLEKGRLVIIVGGLGRPYFTTDSAASLVAIELGADVLLKGTRVNGVYTDDPLRNPAAVQLPKLTFKEAYEQKLRVMDMTAFTLCEENNLPMVVFDASQPGHLCRLLRGECIGTVISAG